MTFFLSDNGGVGRNDKDWADNSPLRAGKGTLYEGGIRVPFFGVYPGGWPQDTVYDGVVSSLDIAATIMASSGIESRLDGVNLDVYVRRGERVPRTMLYWQIRAGDSHYSAAYRIEAYKLIIRTDGEVELYHLESDISESVNLVNR